jgi:hypothetical protein
LFAADLRHSQQRNEREAGKGFCSASDGESGINRLDAAANDFFRELLTEDYGVVVMRVRDAGGAPSAGRAPSGSPFSQALIEGLGGKADENADGTVYLHELSRYMSGRVRELSGNKQSSIIERPRGVPSFPLTKPK